MYRHNTAARLCAADLGQIFRWDGMSLRWAAGYALTPEFLETQRERVYQPGRGSLVSVVRAGDVDAHAYWTGSRRSSTGLAHPDVCDVRPLEPGDLPRGRRWTQLEVDQ